jgi:hypothetical protein
MNSFNDAKQKEVTQIYPASAQPLVEIIIRAGFLRLSVFLWNLFMAVFCILMVFFAISKIARGDYFVGMLFIFACGGLIPMYSKACLSSFGGKVTIYQDRIIQENAFGSKTIKFSNALLMIHNPKFAGGPVLFFTETPQYSLLNRLRTILILSKVMLIHIWMLSDTEMQRMAKTLSNLSGRPDSAFSSLGGYHPFYLRVVESDNMLNQQESTKIETSNQPQGRP